MPPSLSPFTQSCSYIVAWFLSWANGFVVIVIVVDDDSDYSEEVVCGLELCLRLLSTESWWMGRARAKKAPGLELYRASDSLSAAADEELARLRWRLLLCD